MSDTPETDKWTGLRHRINDLVETSRRLERERDEARREAARWRDIANDCKWPKTTLSWETK